MNFVVCAESRDASGESLWTIGMFTLFLYKITTGLSATEWLRFPGVPNPELSESVWKSDQFYVASNPPQSTFLREDYCFISAEGEFYSNPKVHSYMLSLPRE